MEYEHPLFRATDIWDCGNVGMRDCGNVGMGETEQRILPNALMCYRWVSWNPILTRSVAGNPSARRLRATPLKVGHGVSSRLLAYPASFQPLFSTTQKNHDNLKRDVSTLAVKT